MKDKVKYGHELLDIEIPEGTDLSILLPKQHPTGVRSEEEIAGPSHWGRAAGRGDPCRGYRMYPHQ